MIKVITAKQMQQIEAKSIEEGANGGQYMLAAAAGIAEFVECDALLIVGKGNNGGDAFAVGEILLERGFSVRAFVVAEREECSELCQEHWLSFEVMGGEVTRELAPFGKVILDGLLGTGFQGEVSGELGSVIERVNSFDQMRISIDIPSGVNGSSGEVLGPAIDADLTIYLGLPKVGFFQNGGFGKVGKLQGVDFGLAQKYIEQLEPVALLPERGEVRNLLPEVVRERHKYEAGYVVAVAGSPGMAGAAMLSSHAALRSGAGIVRLFHPEGMEKELVEAPFELVKAPYVDVAQIFDEMKRAKSVLIGPGLGRSEEKAAIVKSVIENLSQPALIDADALYHLGEIDLKSISSDLVLTPHAGEFHQMAGGILPQKYVNENGVVLVLKGAPTWIYTPDAPPVISIHGDPGMATAGSGDVLSGVIAALLAQGLSGRDAAILGTHLHGVAGEIAADDKTSMGLIASDLIEELPNAIAALD